MPRALVSVSDKSGIVEFAQGLAAMGYEALLGRDVLAKCVFHYDGPGGWFRLAW